MDDGKWTLRPGEDEIYIARIGEGGYGEIHEVPPYERNPTNTWNRSIDENVIK